MVVVPSEIQLLEGLVQAQEAHERSPDDQMAPLVGAA